MCDYSLLTKVFSRAVFSELLEYSCSSTLNEVIQTFIDNPYENTYGQNIDILYKILKKDYRNEYLYKNTLINKWIYGKYSPTTATALTEIPIGTAKADFIVINGEATVYEIKTELDNLERLDSQVENYFKVFKYVNIVTCDSKAQILREKYKDSPVGIKVLTKKLTISDVKSAEEYDAGIQLDELFNVLRKYEYENIIKNHYGELPNVSAFHYYEACKRMFMEMDKEHVYRVWIKELKKRMQPDIRVKNIPEPLKFLSYFCKMRAWEFRELEMFLQSKFKEVEECTTLI